MTPEQTEKMNSILLILGAVIPLLSAIASLLNSSIRKTAAAGKEPSKVLLAFASILNVLAINLDKGVQLARMAQGKPVVSTGSLPETTPTAPLVVITADDEKLIAEGKHPKYRLVEHTNTPPAQ